jgi:hypothetical protein
LRRAVIFARAGRRLSKTYNRRGHIATLTSRGDDTIKLVIGEDEVSGSMRMSQGPPSWLEDGLHPSLNMGQMAFDFDRKQP